MGLRTEVPEDDAGTRLDVYVAKVTGASRAQAGGLVDDGLVNVNGDVQRKAYRVAPGDVVDVGTREEVVFEAPSGVEVVFEDDDLLVVSKPSGVVVHAASGVREGTLVDALLARGTRLAPRGGEGRPGIVHRLDRDVSGLLVVAKTDEAHEGLVAAMRQRAIERRYIALVVGSPPSDTGKIDAPVGRNPKHRTRMAVVPEGKPAVTWFAVTERLEGASLLDVKLETGRTHQIRTHLASIGHPIVGDAAYGRDPAFARSIGVDRPFLHAYRLAFAHPRTGEALVFESPLPPELEAALEKAR
jgi:23S rRNA pseudouridine1911/1915/1917 synthase